MLKLSSGLAASASWLTADLFLGLLKVTVIVALALAADSLIASRVTSLARHRMWTATIMLALAVPIAPYLVPAWRVLPSNRVLSLVADRPTAAAVEHTPPRWVGVVDSSEIPADRVRPGYGTRPPTASLATTQVAVAAPEESLLAAEHAGARNAGGWMLLFGASWLLGALVSAARLLGGLVREHLWTRGSVPATPEWQAHGRSVARRLGLRRPFRLGESRSVDMPVTSGTLRPIVLIPHHARRWSDARRQLVLAHELIHVRRLDALRQLGTRLLECLFWFHPLVGLAARRAAAAREQACDEAVLALGTRPSDYAGHLLAIANGGCRAQPRTALAMAQTSQLERRLLVILDPSRPKHSSTIALMAVALLFVAGIALAAAMPEPPEVPVAPSPPMPALAAVSSAPAAAPAAPQPVTAPAAPQSVTVPAALAVPRSPAALPMPDSPPAPLAPAIPVPSPATAPSARSAYPGQAGLGLGLPAVSRSASLASAAVSPALATVAAGRGSRSSRASRAAGVSENPCEGAIEGSFRGTYWHHDSDDGPAEIIGTWNGNRLVRLNIRDDLRLCLFAVGEVEIPRGGNIVLGPDAQVEIQTLGGSRRQHLVMTRGADGGIGYRFSVDGRERPWDDAGQRWLTAALDLLADREEMVSLHGEVGSLRGEIGSIHGEEGSMRGEIGSVYGEIGSLRGEIGSIHGEHGSLKGEIGSLRGEISSLRAERWRADASERRKIDEGIAGLEAEIVDLEARYDAEVEDAKVRIAEIEAEIASIDRSRIPEIEAQIKALDTEGRVAEIEAQIETLDADARIAEIESEIETKTERLEAAIRRFR